MDSAVERAGSEMVVVMETPPVSGSARAATEPSVVTAPGARSVAVAGWAMGATVPATGSIPEATITASPNVEATAPPQRP